MPSEAFLSSLVETYTQTLRTPLFSGFLTLTGFLFSMKSFLLANLQRDIYSNKEYLQQWAEARLEDASVGTVARPLRNLGRILLATICATLTTSILQITIGLVPNVFTVVTCLVATLASLAMVAFSIVVLWQNINDWMDVLDKQGEVVLRTVKKQLESGDESEPE